MQIYRGSRFRIYPSAEQRAKLEAWISALRFLWNLAHEQRLLGLARPKDEKRYPSAFDQIRELTELRAQLPWLAEVPRHLCVELLVYLDRGWQRFFKKISGMPTWKRKGRDEVPLCETDPKLWRIDGETLMFPKFGAVRIRVHRPLEGRPKRCSIRRDGDQWVVAILCASEVPDPLPSLLPAVGIDRGVVNLLADSTGRLVENPRHLDRLQRRIAHAQRVASRKRKGSKNRQKALNKASRLYRRVRRQRIHVLHVESTRYAKNHGVIVIEKLYMHAMAASASGTVEHPGSHVRCKSGLNRSILSTGWGRFAEYLRYKVIPLGGEVREVVAAYTSCTCSKCGVVDSASRKTQARFACTSCGHRENADVNAAKVICSRGTHGEAVSGGSAAGRPVKEKLRVVRRGSRRPSATG